MIDITKFYITNEDLVVGNTFFSLDSGEVKIIHTGPTLVIVENLNGVRSYYFHNGNNFTNSLYPTLFKSNPFATEIVEEVKTVVEETEHDFYGQLEGFPKEVVEKMLDRQVEQGNVRDITVFEGRANSGYTYNGFTWSNTIEDHVFWYDIIQNRDFNLFFEKYPKLNKKVLIRGDTSKGPEIIAYLEKLGGVNEHKYYALSKHMLYYINEENTVRATPYENRYRDSKVSDYTIIEI